MSRAALKRAIPEAEHCVPGKKSEADTVETVALQQDSEQSDSPSSQHVSDDSVSVVSVVVTVLIKLWEVHIMKF